MTEQTRWARGRGRAGAALVGAATLATATSAGAAPGDPPEIVLFKEGKTLMANPATLAEGCRKLEESFKLAVRGDTLLNLAFCHEKLGKTATAWAEYNKAIAEAERVKYGGGIEAAKARRDELAAKLSTLTVTVPAAMAALDGLVLEVNGKPFPREQWNTALNLDPGPFEVTAVAKGYLRFSRRVDLAPDRDRKVVTVVLELVPAPPSPAPPPPPPAPLPPPPKPIVVVSPPRPIWPWIVGGTGIALVGASIGFAVDQLAASHQLDNACGANRQSCPLTYNFAPTRAREVRDRDLFVGLGAVGLAAAGAGAVGLGLGFRGRSRVETSLQLTPTSVALQGVF